MNVEVEGRCRLETLMEQRELPLTHGRSTCFETTAPRRLDATVPPPQGRPSVI